MLKNICFGSLCLLIISGSLPPLSAAPEATGKGYEFEGNGKRDFDCTQTVYTPDSPPAGQMSLGPQKRALEWALRQQKPRLAKAAPWSSEGLNLSASQLKHVAKQVTALPEPFTMQDLNRHLQAYLIQGEDGCGNTHFTAYFAPLIQVKAKADAQFKYPLYRKPDSWPGGSPLSRQQIDGDKALAGLGLEIGYAESLLDIFLLQVQGSGVAEFIDTGEKVTFQYSGQNGLKYASLGRYLVEQNYVPADKISLNAIREFFDAQPEKLETFLYVNPSYTFFTKVKAGPKGTLNTEVVPRVSIAVDPKFIPLGSVLLAEIPKLNDQGEFLGHQFTLLVAQDTGGAIKGPGHVDLYMGEGLKAQKLASNMHHYGRIWLLLPK